MFRGFKDLGFGSLGLRKFGIWGFGVYLPSKELRTINGLYMDHI